MVKSARELFKGANLAKMTNTKTIKYGKVAENIAYEIVETNYYDEEKESKLYILSFVTEIDDKYIYNVDECFDGTLDEIMIYIAECKKEKKILKRKEV